MKNFLCKKYKVLSLIFVLSAFSVFQQEKTAANETNSNNIVENKENENWVEETHSIKGFIDLGSQTLNFGFGYSGNLELSDKKSNEVQLSKPDVYIKDGNSLIKHIWGNQNSSSNFLLAIPEKDENGNFNSKKYKIFSTPGIGGKIYSLKNKNGEVKKLKGVVEKEIPNYGRVEITTILEKTANNYIYHHVTIKNLNNKPLDFSYMKSVDTELAGNDSVPVYMLKNKEGLYIETNNYRLNYVTNVENGPDNFRNWYNGGYRNPTKDGFENIYLPFYPANDLNGLGDESKDYKPNDKVIGRGDTGIWMKWNITTLQPNESKTFSYAASLYSRFEANTSAKNNTLDKNAVTETNYNKDNISVNIVIDILSAYKKDNFEGNLTSKFSIFDVNDDSIPNKIVIDKPFKIVDENGELIREIDSSAFDYENQTFKIEISNTDAREGKIHFIFDIDANKNKDLTFSNIDNKIKLENKYAIKFQNNYTSTYADEIYLNIEKKYNVVYDFEKIPEENRDLPLEIQNLKPKNVTDIINKTVVSPSNDFEKTFIDNKNDGVWTFKNWNKNSDTINKNDIHFVGFWEFSPNKYTVSHKFEKTQNSINLPDELLKLTPKNIDNKFNGEVVSPSNDFEKTFIDNKNDGVWTFKNWNKDSDTINKNDIQFVGFWEFSPNKYTVSHKFEKTQNSIDLPDELLKLTPKNIDNKFNGEVVSPSNDFKKTFIDNKNDGVWTFKNWNKDSDTINKNDVLFIGFWEFKKNYYPIIKIEKDKPKEEIKDEIIENKPNVVEEIKDEIKVEKILPKTSINSNSNVLNVLVSSLMLLGVSVLKKTKK